VAAGPEHAQADVLVASEAVAADSKKTIIPVDRQGLFVSDNIENTVFSLF
jgi:hypothetical protein